jgi:hypothetical protein
MSDSTDTGLTQDDLTALAKAVREAARPEPPYRERPQSTAIFFNLPMLLFNQMAEWRTAVTRQLGRADVTDADVFRVLTRILTSDVELRARVIEHLRSERNS